MINKLLDEKIRSLAMWSIALLINTSSWDDMMHNWKLICCVFLQLHTGIEDSKNEYHDALLSRISKIRADPNISSVIQSSGSDSSHPATHSDTFDYNDTDEDINHDGEVLTSNSQINSKKTKNERVSCANEASCKICVSSVQNILP